MINKTDILARIDELLCQYQNPTALEKEMEELVEQGINKYEALLVATDGMPLGDIYNEYWQFQRYCSGGVHYSSR